MTTKPYNITTFLPMQARNIYPFLDGRLHVNVVEQHK